MDLHVWLLFVVTEAALCLTPGPAVLYVTSQGLSRGFWPSVGANFGIVTGNVVYFTASALGLGALILASHAVFLVVKWCGVAYLVWMGSRMLVGAAGIASVEPAPRALAGEIFRGGVLVQLANPKNLIFFLAVLPPFIDPAGSVPIQVLILGVTSQVIEVVTLLLYGSLASGARRWMRTPRSVSWANRFAGSMLLSAGAGLALIRRADG